MTDLASEIFAAHSQVVRYEHGLILLWGEDKAYMDSLDFDKTYTIQECITICKEHNLTMYAYWLGKQYQYQEDIDNMPVFQSGVVCPFEVLHMFPKFYEYLCENGLEE